MSVLCCWVDMFSIGMVQKLTFWKEYFKLKNGRIKVFKRSGVSVIESQTNSMHDSHFMAKKATFKNR